MKIKSIEIKDYKAFYKKHSFDISGKNVFVYGENGSGKSSFYYALKDFFQSSIENLDYDETENIFLTNREKGKGYINITFNPNAAGQNADGNYFVKKTSKNTDSSTDTSIKDAIKLKSFLTYKHLLEIHHISKDGDINLFNLLVKGVLKHYKNVAITGTKELGELWDEVEKAFDKPLNGRVYNITHKTADVDAALLVFNGAFSQLFDPAGRENILQFAEPILAKFGYNIKIKLNFTPVRPKPGYNEYERNKVEIEIEYLGKPITKPHLFLNEARLSAIAISIYLGMIKRHPQTLPGKFIFLDDIFIGLDIGNRLPLLKILDTDFQDYQIFITTYDKPWYEFVRSSYLSNNSSWKSFEFYSRRSRKGFEIPIVKEIKGRGNGDHINHYLTMAQEYFNSADNKAAGVYLRSAFEFILKQYCFGRVPLAFKLNTAEIKTDEFWNAVKNYKRDRPTRCNLTPATTTAIDQLSRLVLNPLSHHDINKHEITQEIQNALTAITTLKNELGV